MSTEGIDYTGYVRYTDVQFSWKDSVPRTPEGANPLAALLALDVLVHPDHPLRLEGDDGIRLYQCLIKGEQKLRLCFSTAQLQYLQYWLCAVGLTKEPIPLPSSAYILRESQLDDVDSVVYNDPAVLKKAPKKIEKMGKHLLGMSASLKDRYKAFDLGRTYWTSKTGTWLAIDFEEWERDHTALLEFGYSKRTLEDGKEDVEDGHVIIEEHYTCRNTQYVRNGDQKDNFKFGMSQQMSKSKVQFMISKMIHEALTKGPLFLVFHDHHGDMQTLQRLGAPLGALKVGEYPEQAPTKPDIYVFDTAQLFAALEGSPLGNTRKLQYVCQLLDIPTECLHNAGNDAHYTLRATQSMLSGDAANIQQHKRWPKHETHRAEVKFEKWHLDPDYDGECDEDDIIPEWPDSD